MITCVAVAGHFWLAVSGQNAMINLDEITVTIERPAKLYATRVESDRIEIHFKNKGTVTIKGNHAMLQKAIMSCKK